MRGATLLLLLLFLLIFCRVLYLWLHFLVRLYLCLAAVFTIAVHGELLILG